VRAIGLRLTTGGHTSFVREIVDLCARRREEIKIFGGRGGTITHADSRQMYRRDPTDLLSPHTAQADEVKSTNDTAARERHTVSENASEEWRVSRRLSARGTVPARRSGGARAKIA